MRTGLLDHYKSLGTPPPDAEADALTHGVRLVSPQARAWDTTHDFLHAYCRDFTPAGVLVVASDPAHAGALETGIALTDAEHARHELQLSCSGTIHSPAAARFWGILNDVRNAMGEPPLESFFSNVHLTHAFPYGAVATNGGAYADAPALVHGSSALQRVTRAHLARLLALTRPQAVACVGRFAFEAVAACAENALDLAASLVDEDWSAFVTRYAYDAALRAYPKAEYRSFRARLVPLDDATARGEAHAQATLAELFADAWT